MNKGRRNQPLCDNSMKMALNIVKLSSFSIAKMSLGTTAPSPATVNLESSTGSVKVVNDAAMPRFPGNRRSQELHSGSKPVSYLVELVEGNGSRDVIGEENSIDQKASDYIKKVHQKNQYGSNEASTLSLYILPPPPRVLM